MARFHFLLRPFMARHGHVGGLLRVKELLQERRNGVSTLSKWLQLFGSGQPDVTLHITPDADPGLWPRCCVNGRSNWLAPPPQAPIGRWGRFGSPTYHDSCPTCCSFSLKLIASL
jgi:hypothetical protein